ncbi:conserved hypothetical protein [Histoplasma capsulatum var. duboisii H88]|uniref:Uncharacterized protein n=1 Tax=Ajellomyces capsulatus (strain H88) TaxID=544711 RepID=F0UE29_AJEC8|nr:conserved hypothetical protein [Histoplasma capsulatum var. duboisii H88]QSS55333.1 hypothetical protein I7I53_03190 [Histoplasma capsulatum var. duboisii H88]
MGYLSAFRQSLSSFLTPKKSPLERPQPRPLSPTTSATETYAHSFTRALRRRSMSPTSKTQDWLSSTTSSQFGGTSGDGFEFVNPQGKTGYRASNMSEIMETPKDAYRNFMQLPTPAKSGLKRKLGFDRRGPQSGTQISDSEYDLEGDTIAVDEVTPAKRRRVGEGLVYVGDRETTASQLHEERDLLEGDTLGVDDTESMPCSGVESGAGGSDIVNDEPKVCDDADVDSQITTDDLGADGDDEVLLVHSRPDKVNRGSKTSCDTDGTYRPSPHAVDKNLTKRTVHQTVENELSEEEVVGRQHIVSKNERKEVAFDFSLERAERWVAAIKLPKGYWAEAEEDLFYRLAMRGFEPLVPSNWQLDFSTLPESLFGLPGDITPPYISATGGSDFRAINALTDLFELGSQVRDRQSVHLRPEPVIRRAITRYIKWALYDSNLLNRPNAIPVHAIYSLKPSESTRDALQTLNHRLVILANRYRVAWKVAPSVETSFDEKKNNTKNDENDRCDSDNRYSSRSFPVITGFLVCGPILALLTLNSDPKVHPILDSRFSAKFISQFDFGEIAQDVWNSFAVAIAVVRMRKTMTQLEAEGQGDVMWMDCNEADSVDPDL